MIKIKEEHSHRPPDNFWGSKIELNFETTNNNLEVKLFHKKIAQTDAANLKNEFCRTCLLQTNDVTYLTTREYIGGESRLILDVLNSLFQVTENDKMPVGICIQCLGNAKLAFCFKEQCQKADKVLAEYLEMLRIKKSSEISYSSEDNYEFVFSDVKDEPFFDKPLEEFTSNNEKDTTVPINIEIFENNPVASDDNNIGDDFFEEAEGNIDSEKDPNICATNLENRADDDVKRNQCTVCNKKVRNMQQHMKRHTGRTHTCEACGKSYPNRCDLRNHLTAHSADRPYKCNKCPKAFTQKYKLNQHELGHEGKKAFICELCGKGFNRRKELASHNRVHTGLKPYQCSICEKSFVGSYTLLRHLKIHTGEKEYTCDHCRKSFSAKEPLKVHLRLHTGEKPYSCPEDGCDRNFATAYSLKIHQPVHSGVKPFSCATCGKLCARIGDLRKHEATHIKRHLAEALPPPVKADKHILCTHCGKSFVRKADLKRHIFTHTQEKPFKCPQCDKGFNQQYGLTQHLRYHTGLACFVCDLCGKGFMRKATMEKHKLVHLGIKSHKCEFCSKAFTISAHLIRHRRIHTGERPYECDVCHKTFSGRSGYVVHLRSHTGEKPYQCKFCDKTYTTSTAMKIHTRNHTGEKPYICPKCSNAFSRSDLRSHHMRICCPKIVAEPIAAQQIPHGFYLQQKDNGVKFQSLSTPPKTRSIHQSANELDPSTQMPLHSIRLDNAAGGFGATLLSTETSFITLASHQHDVMIPNDQDVIASLQNYDKH